MEHGKGVQGDALGFSMRKAVIGEGSAHGVLTQGGQVIQIFGLFLEQGRAHCPHSLGAECSGGIWVVGGDPVTARFLGLADHFIHGPERVVQVEGNQLECAHGR